MANIACGTFDVSNLSADEYISFDDKTLWMKSEVEEKIIIYDGRPHAIIKFSNKLESSICEDNKQLNQQAAHLDEEARKQNPNNNPNQPKNDPYVTANPNPVGSGKANIERTQKDIDISDINTFGFEKPAVMPVAAVISMKSNTITYGPYISSNFAISGASGYYGGTSVETNPDLCPWVFGSIASMNSVGNNIVQSKALGLTRAETGSATIPGLPVSGLSRLGDSVANVGPTLSSMSFTFGSNGITTTYEFSTYTPKFGNLTGNQIDRMKSIAKFRQEQTKFLRTQAIQQNKTSRQLMMTYGGMIKNKTESRKPAPDKNTTQRVLMAEMYEHLIPGVDAVEKPKRTVVVLGSLEKAGSSMIENYPNKAYMSLDGIFGPVSINGDGNFPRFTNYEIACHQASPLQPQPPFSTYEELDNGLDQYNLKIDQDHTNPLTNKFLDGEHHHNGPGYGHAIDLLGREDAVPKVGLRTSAYSTTDEARYSEDYRFLGLRGPMVLHSWGYDTEGKPIPNASDNLDDMAAGNFTENNLKDKFFPNWLQHPSSWPVGPIDLRFDRKRGMWVTPQGYKVVVAQLTEALEPYSSATAKLINENSDEDQIYGQDLWDKEGNAVKATEEDDTQAYIKLVDRIGSSFNEDDLVYAYYDTFNCEYIVLATSKQDSIIKFALVQDKNLTTREVSAIIVDKYGYPLRKDGKTPIVDQNDFNANTITVRDPYLNNNDLPAPRGPGQIPSELTAFGPALGSVSLEEHINGIQLTDGYTGNDKTIGPFMGYALKREPKKIDSESESDEEDPIYEIITLEHFAKYIIGKIGSVNSNYLESIEGANDGFYLGARIDHRQGVVPVGRGHGQLPNNLNVILRSNLNQFDGTHTYIIGDIIDNPIGNGNIVDDVDGCRFIACLDNEVSTTTNLVYDIIECETSALTCSYHIKDQEYGNDLNRGDTVKFDNTNYIEGKFIHGFMWDPVLSKEHYEDTTLDNNGVDRNDLNTGKIIVGCRGMAQLVDIEDGNLKYVIITKSEIANVAQRYLNVDNPGLFGCPDFDIADAEDRKIGEYDEFWDGLEPEDIPDDNKPIITMSDEQQWMTYDQAIITASWDEYGNRQLGFDGAVEDCKYKIVYAQEAPVIMTCVASSIFTPVDVAGINLSKALVDILPSCQGANRDPIPAIFEGNIFNPMGYGAKIGDLVTIQRVFVGSDMSGIAFGHPKCNYKYIVIGTGKPPAVP